MGCVGGVRCASWDDTIQRGVANSPSPTCPLRSYSPPLSRVSLDSVLAGCGDVHRAEPGVCGSEPGELAWAAV